MGWARTVQNVLSHRLVTERRMNNARRQAKGLQSIKVWVGVRLHSPPTMTSSYYTLPSYLLSRNEMQIITANVIIVTICNMIISR